MRLQVVAATMASIFKNLSSVGHVVRRGRFGGKPLKKLVQIRTEAESKRQAAALARRLDPGPLMQDRQLMLQQAEELEAEAAQLESQADALERRKDGLALYREKAEEARAIAESIDNTEARAAVLDVAASWQGLADAEEKARERKLPRSV
jgi:hypothetical protein